MTDGSHEGWRSCCITPPLPRHLMRITQGLMHTHSPVPSRAAYAAWRTEYADVYSPLLVRAAHAWASILAWLQEHIPDIADSVRPGASRELLAEVEAELGHELPPALRAVYRWGGHVALCLCWTQQQCTCLLVLQRAVTDIAKWGSPSTPLIARHRDPAALYSLSASHPSLKAGSPARPAPTAFWRPSTLQAARWPEPCIRRGGGCTRARHARQQRSRHGARTALL